MKALAILLLISLPCMAQRLTIHRKAITVGELLEVIRLQTKLLPIYTPDALQDAPLLDINCRNMDVRTLLNSCFSGLKIGYYIENRSLCIFRKVNLGASLYSPLMGRVQNAEGEPLEGASIIVDSIPMQITREGGLFSLPVRARRTMVTISFLGYSSDTICLANDVFQVVSLQRTASTLDQVVVQPYGTTTERLATGSVTSIRGSDITSQPGGNILAALEGRIPGMVIRENNGVPGSAYSVLIRGPQSIAQGTNPLIVINDVPVGFNDGFLGTIGTGSAQGANGASDLNGIPVTAIESIEVLKGAAATAIYGSRGSNGVLLLTMKTGAAGRLTWDADVYTGADRAVGTSALLNTTQYLNLRKQAVENDGLPINAATVPELFLWDTIRNTNFKQLVMGHARLRDNAHIEVTGGDTSTTFLLSGDYHREAAVFPGRSNDDRISLYGQFHHQSSNRRFHVDFSALYSWENNLLPTQDYTRFETLAPDAPSFLDSTGHPSWSSNGIPFLNIPALENNTYVASVTNQFNHLQLSYHLLPGLELRTNLGYYRIGSLERSEEPIDGQDPTYAPTGQASYTGNHSHSELGEGLAEYKRTAGRGQLEALVGANWQDQQTHTSSSSYNNSWVYRYEAVFGRVNYVWNDHFIYSLSGRRDGSSRFGPGNQFGNFWAAGAAWIFIDNPFLEQPKWFSFGKVRASLGTTGNDQIGNNVFQQVYSTTNASRGYQGSQGIVPTTFYNTNLHWEVNHSDELSLELGFLRNKILLSATAYRDWTGNQLLYTSLARQSGLPGVVQNVPVNVTNEGLELSLQTFSITSKKFRWTSTVTLTVPVNRLARFPDLAVSPYAEQLVVGRSLSVVQGYHYTGVNPTTGLFQFSAVDGSPFLDSRDILPGGNTDVHYYGGCSQTLRYKNWQLDLFVEFRVQGGINPYVILYEQNPPGFAGPSMLSNAPVEWLHRWQRPGDHTSLEKATENFNSDATAAIYAYLTSDALVTDASFVRLKSMRLSYQLPERQLTRQGLRECRLYLEGQNLLTFTQFPVTDPETQDPTVLPPMRTIVAGVRMVL